MIRAQPVTPPPIALRTGAPQPGAAPENVPAAGMSPQGSAGLTSARGRPVCAVPAGPDDPSRRDR